MTFCDIFSSSLLAHYVLKLIFRRIVTVSSNTLFSGLSQFIAIPSDFKQNYYWLKHYFSDILKIKFLSKLEAKAPLKDFKHVTRNYILSIKTRMHSSRMRTARCSGRLSCHACPRHTCPLPHMPPPPLPRMPSATHTPLWTEFLTHVCKNIKPILYQNFPCLLTKNSPLPDFFDKFQKLVTISQLFPFSWF